MRVHVEVCLCSALLLACAALAQPSQSGANPQRAKVWEDAELRAITLPPALPEGKILYLPSEAYYKQKPLTIYKTYPVYSIDQEPPGYLDWLARQEPEIVFDPRKPPPESEWKALGQTVFEAPTDFAPAETIHDREWYSKVRPPVTREGVVPAYSYVIRKKGLVEVGSGSCAMCHSRVLPDGAYVPGAQGNFPVERAYAENLRRRRLAKAPPRNATGLLLPLADVARWTDHLYERSRNEVLAVSEAMIAGVAMRPGFSYLDPPKIADLIGVRDRRYLDLTVRLVHRSVGDIARYGSMCWASNYFFSKDDRIPDAAVSAVSDSMRYSDEEAYIFAQYVYSLEPPRNPNKPSALSKAGKAVFEREGCPACHTPPLYTNNKIIPAGDFQPPADHRAKYDILDTRIGTDPAAAVDSLRGRGYYKVPSLKGVWYRGPFTHNGTIETLEDWFDPNRLRNYYVPTGYRALGTHERVVPGHLFGLSLNPRDKAALFAFLYTL
jgi:hypothetical protein